MQVKKKSVKYLLTLVSIVILSSCVSQKEMVYLQGNTSGLNKVTAVNAKYHLQVNDVLQIQVKALDQNLVKMFSTQTDGTANNKNNASGLYFNGYNIDNEGNIRIPVLGKLFVLGKTTDEVQNIISKKLLSDYFKKDTYIFVSAKLSGFRITVQGEVGKPGTITLYQNNVTILEALANAGDINDIGDRKTVLLIRKTPNGQDIHTLDLTQIEVLNSPYFNLEPNDYIYVKPLKQKSWGTGTTGTQTLTTVFSVLSLVTTVILLTR